jgi:hypothetical protein
MTCEGWDARGCRFAIVAVILALPLLPCTRTALYPLDSYLLLPIYQCRLFA